jgi:hypothetical protein
VHEINNVTPNAVAVGYTCKVLSSEIKIKPRKELSQVSMP